MFYIEKIVIILIIIHYKINVNDYYFQETKTDMISIFLNGGVALVLSLVFLIHDLYFKIILLFISLLFKFYPIKFYFGILKRGIEGLR